MGLIKAGISVATKVAKSAAAAAATKVIKDKVTDFINEEFACKDNGGKSKVSKPKISSCSNVPSNSSDSDSVSVKPIKRPAPIRKTRAVQLTHKIIENTHKTLKVIDLKKQKRNRVISITIFLLLFLATAVVCGVLDKETKYLYITIPASVIATFDFFLFIFNVASTIRSDIYGDYIVTAKKGITKNKVTIDNVLVFDNDDMKYLFQIDDGDPLTINFSGDSIKFIR